MAARLAAGESLIILKARQLGISWLLAAYARWMAQYRPGALVLELSQGQAEAFELLDKSRRLRAPGVAIGVDRQGELAYADGGRILALPATERAGRSYTATCVIADEAAYHPYAAQNYAAYRPTLDGGGQLVIVSTAAGAGGWFHEMWQAAVAGTVPLAPVFIPWHARPGRDAAWLARERAGYQGLPAQFAQEYPETAAEAFVAHSGLVYGMDDQGVRIFGRESVQEPRTPWGQCRWRVAGLDPGGSDPTGLVALGVGADDRMHVHAIRRLRGAVTLEALADYLSRWEGLDAVVVDAPPQSTLVASLRALGVPAYGAVKDKSFGIGLVSAALRRRDLTVSPGLVELEQEFNSYWWAERRANTTGGQAVATITPAEHHADLLDALRYAVVEAVRGAWRADGQREARERRERWDREQERQHRREQPVHAPGWDVRGTARGGQWRNE